MELEQLRQIEAVARAGTMSAAAAELHISQPALSRSIQRLEAEFGSPLFDREGRRVRLNEVGAVAVEWARQLLRDEALLREAVAAAAERAHALRVATVAPAPLWKLTGLAVERFPGETLTSDTLSQQEVERSVASGAADLGIVVGAADGTYTPPPGVASCALMRESLSVTLPPNHPLAARRKVTFEELDGNTFLILTDIGFWRAYVDRYLPSSTFIEQRGPSRLRAAGALDAALHIHHGCAVSGGALTGTRRRAHRRRGRLRVLLSHRARDGGRGSRGPFLLG